MRIPKTPFAEQENHRTWYDLFEDYELIEASFAQQYGIRLRREDEMSWSEFVTLLAGLNEKTPLGKVVSIRSETDENIIRNFTPEQRRIQREWRTRAAKSVSVKEYESAMEGFKQMFLGLADKGGG